MNINELRRRIDAKVAVISDIENNPSQHPNRDLAKEKKELDALKRRLDIAQEINKEFCAKLIELLWQQTWVFVISSGVSKVAQYSLGDFSRKVEAAEDLQEKANLVIGAATYLSVNDPNNRMLKTFRKDVCIILNAAGLGDPNQALTDPVINVISFINHVKNLTVVRIVTNLCRLQKREELLDPSLTRQEAMMAQEKEFGFDQIPKYWSMNDDAKSHYEKLYLQAHLKSTQLNITGRDIADSSNFGASNQSHQDLNDVLSLEKTCTEILLKELAARFGLRDTQGVNSAIFLSAVKNKAPNRSWLAWSRREPDEHETLVRLIDAANKIDRGEAINQQDFYRRLNRVEHMLLMKSAVIKDEQAIVETVALQEESAAAKSSIVSRISNFISPKKKSGNSANQGEAIRQRLIAESIETISDAIQKKQTNKEITKILGSVTQRSDEERALSAQLSVREKTLASYNNVTDISPGKLELPAQLPDLKALAYFIFQRHATGELPITWTHQNGLTISRNNGTFSRLIDSLDERLYALSPTLYFSILMISIALMNVAQDEYIILRSVLEAICSIDDDTSITNGLKKQLPEHLKWFSDYIPNTIKSLGAADAFILKEIKAKLLEGDGKEVAIFSPIIINEIRDKKSNKNQVTQNENLSFSDLDQKYIQTVCQQAENIKKDVPIREMISKNLLAYSTVNRYVLAAFTLCEWYETTPGGVKNLLKNKGFIEQYNEMRNRLFSAIVGNENFPLEEIEIFIEKMRKNFKKLLRSQDGIGRKDSSLKLLLDSLENIEKNNYPKVKKPEQNRESINEPQAESVVDVIEPASLLPSEELLVSVVPVEKSSGQEPRDLIVNQDVLIQEKPKDGNQDVLTELKTSIVNIIHKSFKKSDLKSVNVDDQVKESLAQFPKQINKPELKEAILVYCLIDFYLNTFPQADEMVGEGLLEDRDNLAAFIKDYSFVTINVTLHNDADMNLSRLAHAIQLACPDEYKSVRMLEEKADIPEQLAKGEIVLSKKIVTREWDNIPENQYTAYWKDGAQIVGCEFLPRDKAALLPQEGEFSTDKTLIDTIVSQCHCPQATFGKIVKNEPQNIEGANAKLLQTRNSIDESQKTLNNFLNEPNSYNDVLEICGHQAAADLKRVLNKFQGHGRIYSERENEQGKPLPRGMERMFDSLETHNIVLALCDIKKIASEKIHYSSRFFKPMRDAETLDAYYCIDNYLNDKNGKTIKTNEDWKRFIAELESLTPKSKLESKPA